jgi:hypothetical protein
MWFIIFLIIILIIVLFLFFKNRQNIDYFHLSTDKNIGNCLSRYFGSMGLSFYNGKDFYAESSFKKDPYLQKLPMFIPVQNDIQRQLHSIEFSSNDISTVPNSYWVIENTRAENFWLIMKPLVTKILFNFLKTHDIVLDVNLPVIHFRCSDVPFVRNSHYHFVKYSFYKDCLLDAEILLNKKYTSLLLLSCHNHKSNPVYKEKCNEYESSLIKYLRNLGYQVNVQCNSNILDFALMFYAPVVLSPSSSFSFMSGFFGPGLFYSEGHFTEDVENPEKNTTPLESSDWLKSGYSIRHSDVKNYENTREVIQMLMN